jgi:glycosyltransferase involved in cell wall biosynthesis
MIPNSFFGYKSCLGARVNSTPTINVGFAAMDPKSWIKGGDIVAALITRHAKSQDFKFFALSDFDNYEDFWGSIDVLLVPSRADNSPNVIHEAKLWGKPVLASMVGGIPEILYEDFDGYIPLQASELSEIEVQIRRVVSIAQKKNVSSEVAKRHREYLDTSIPRHLHHYRSIPFQ